MGTSNVYVAHTLSLVWRAIVCVDMASEHEIERSSMGHMDDVIDISFVYFWNYIADHHDRGRYSGWGLCNH
jgi:hypothetical protein